MRFQRTRLLLFNQPLLWDRLSVDLNRQVEMKWGKGFFFFFMKLRF